MFRIWEQAVDNNKVSGALLTNLRKAFDYIRHDLLIAKQNVYGQLFYVLKLVMKFCVFIITFKIASKEKKLGHLLAFGNKLLQVFNKDLFWNHFCSIYFYVIWLYVSKTTTAQTILTITLLMWLEGIIITWYQSEWNADLGKCTWFRVIPER